MLAYSRHLELQEICAPAWLEVTVSYSRVFSASVKYIMSNSWMLFMRIPWKSKAVDNYYKCIKIWQFLHEVFVSGYAVEAIQLWSMHAYGGSNLLVMVHWKMSTTSQSYRINVRFLIDAMYQLKAWHNFSLVLKKSEMPLALVPEERTTDVSIFIHHNSIVIVPLPSTASSIYLLLSQRPQSPEAHVYMVTVIRLNFSCDKTC